MVDEACACPADSFSTQGFHANAGSHFRTRDVAQKDPYDCPDPRANEDPSDTNGEPAWIPVRFAGLRAPYNVHMDEHGRRQDG